MKQPLSCRCLPLSLLLFLAAPLGAAQPPGPSAAEAVRARVIEFNQAYARNDLEAYFAFYLTDATLWTNEDRATVEQYRATWSEFLAAGGAVRGNALSEIQVRVSPAADSAVASYRLDVETLQPDGSVSTDRAQETDVWFRVDGEWKIAHLHYAFQPVE